MTLTRRALIVARNTLSSIVRRLDVALEPPEKPRPKMNVEQAAETARQLQRQSLLAGTRPWNYRRPAQESIPENLLYLAETRGTKAVVEALLRRARR